MRRGINQWTLGIGRTVGEAGSRAVATVASLLLAAIGITPIRRGLGAVLREVQP
ncbi:MAG: hypothetical protein ACK4Z6_00530 [Candidatus Methylomirabilales bacterium]